MISYWVLGPLGILGYHVDMLAYLQFLNRNPDFSNLPVNNRPLTPIQNWFPMEYDPRKKGV